MRRDAGFTMVELMVVIAMIGILAVLGMPSLLSYWRTSTTQAGAAELATALNRARQLAISQNTMYCTELTGTNVRYRQNSSTTCTGGTIWTGSGTDGSGVIRLANSVTVTGGPVVFTALGAATLAGTFTVTNPSGGTRSVVVAASGRVSVQ